ncbi:uncharacterized protein LOC130899246 [Diorhabda carinulata]|uniref:uncharacterized protein LOC130899246 n=1 Tax=Diorhabda carinulata TaxID=1163345 RepID=UPI0025A0CD47|nr:uncharacterized protein LOC130899246 [Diorhabda carinulata]
MTRFARAKGSKASNERVPEEATPWNEMKQQLLEKNKYIEESKNRQKAIEQRNSNYRAFIEEKELEESKKSQWAQFPTDDLKNTSLSDKRKKRKSISLMNEKNFELSDNDETFVALRTKVDKVLNETELGERSNKNDCDATPEELSTKIELDSSPKNKKLKKKKISIPSIINTSTNDAETKRKAKKRKNEENIESERNENSENIVSTSSKLKTDKKVKKSKIQPKKVIKENLTEQDIKKLEKKKQKKIKQIEKRKMGKQLKKQEAESEKLTNGVSEATNNLAPDAENCTKTSHRHKFDNQTGGNDNKNKFEKPNSSNRFVKNKKFPKSKDEKEHKRRKPPLPTKMFINGKDVEIDYVDGFPVKKEDAIRLKKLRKEMISKGLPRSEIKIALKLERRKAEKAFSREKKKVCFNCRKSGHNLSECPNLEKDQVSQSGTGICFKCGSTEHTHFECKVVRSQDFKFAQCFICNEQGHIARQCPDNARGLYPKGGSCKVCGDVTHLKKDCPQYQAQQQQLQNSLNIETISDNPDDLGGNTYKNSNYGIGINRPNKIIKF